MDVIFTKHADKKFGVLKRHSFKIDREQVLSAVNNPDYIDKSRLPLLIYQISIDRTHVLRVVCKKDSGMIKVITFYPGRKKMYEKK